jgi:hypothetical protein
LRAQAGNVADLRRLNVLEGTGQARGHVLDRAFGTAISQTILDVIVASSTFGLDYHHQAN